MKVGSARSWIWVVVLVAMGTAHCRKDDSPAGNKTGAGLQPEVKRPTARRVVARRRAGGKNVPLAGAPDATVVAPLKPKTAPCGFPWGLRRGLSKKAFVAHMKKKGLWPKGSRLERFVPPRFANTNFTSARAVFDKKAGLLEVRLGRHRVPKMSGARWYYKRVSTAVQKQVGLQPLDGVYPPGQIYGLGGKPVTRWWLCPKQRQELILEIETWIGPLSKNTPSRHVVRLIYRWTPVPWRLARKKDFMAGELTLKERLNLSAKELGKLLKTQGWSHRMELVQLLPKGRLRIANQGDMVNDVYLGRWVFSGGALYLTITNANTFDWPAEGCNRIWYADPRRCVYPNGDQFLCLRRLDRCGWRSRYHLWTALPAKYKKRPAPHAARKVTAP